MKKLIMMMAIMICFVGVSLSQTQPILDSIKLNSNAIIVCDITYINNNNVFYIEGNKSKFIPLSEIDKIILVDFNPNSTDSLRLTLDLKLYPDLIFYENSKKIANIISLTNTTSLEFSECILYFNSEFCKINQLSTNGIYAKDIKVMDDKYIQYLYLYNNKEIIGETPLEFIDSIRFTNYSKYRNLSYINDINTEINTAGFNLIKAHNQYKSGTFFIIAGIGATALSIPLYAKDYQTATILSVSGAIFSIVGYVIQIDSHKYIKKAGLSMTGNSVKFTF